MTVRIFDLADDLFCQAKNALSQEGTVPPAAFIVTEEAVENISIVKGNDRNLNEDFCCWLRNRCLEKNDVKGLIVISDNWYSISPEKEFVQESIKEGKISGKVAKREGLGLEVYTQKYCRMYRWLYKRTKRGVIFDETVQTANDGMMIDVSSNIDPWPDRGGKVL